MFDVFIGAIDVWKEKIAINFLGAVFTMVERVASE
jgi:hypothetical protein